MMAGLTPREAFIDSLLRLLQAIDDNDASLFESTLTPEAVLDMSGLSEITGHPMPKLEGIQMATMGLLEHGPRKIDTGHTASNLRVEMKDDSTAELSAMGVANHFRKGEGSMPGKVELVAANRYTMEVIDHGNEIWKIRKGEVKNLWCEGDPSVFEH